MSNKAVLCVGMDAESGNVSMHFGKDFEEVDGKLSVELGGGISYPIVLSMFITVLGTLKKELMSKSGLEGVELCNLEKEMYDMLNISVGGFLDKGFPLVNEVPSLTEEACEEYNVDFKNAEVEEILEAENKFIENFTEKAVKCE